MSCSRDCERAQDGSTSNGFEDCLPERAIKLGDLYDPTGKKPCVPPQPHTVWPETGFQSFELVLCVDDLIMVGLQQGW